MKQALVARLSILMFLQFFVWGAWNVTLGLVMQAIGLGSLIGDAFSVGPIASILGSFLIGMVASRFVGSRLLLAMLHLIGGGLLFAIPALLQPAHGATFLWMLLCYMMLYMPTAGLANNVALKSLGGAADRFPFIRAFGTLGWIMAGLAIGWAGLSASPHIFAVAAGASVVLGLYSLTLPAVERDAPMGGGLLRQFLCLDAFALLKQRDFAIFILCAMLISVPLAMYYAYASPFLGTLGIENVSGTLALGQMSELIFMFSMPLLYRRFGVKPLLLMGMLAWAMRYALFALGDGGAGIWAIYAGVLLHGPCYDFFFVAGAIYTSRLASASGVEAQAQGMLTLFTYGFGMLLGSQMGGLLYSYLPPVPSLANWQAIWWWPAGAAAIVALGFQMSFRDAGTASPGR